MLATDVASNLHRTARAWLSRLVHAPVAMLYMEGPTALGFWGGDDMEDICYRLTGTESVFWAQNMDACQSLVGRRLESWLVLADFVVYAALLYKGFRALLWLGILAIAHGNRHTDPPALK